MERRTLEENRENKRDYAVLVGLRGVVVKSHGGADAYAFGQALDRAAEAAAHRLVERIEQKMAGAWPRAASPVTEVSSS